MAKKLFLMKNKEKNDENCAFFSFFWQFQYQSLKNTLHLIKRIDFSLTNNKDLFPPLLK